MGGKHARFELDQPSRLRPYSASTSFNNSLGLRSLIHISASRPAAAQSTMPAPYSDNLYSAEDSDSDTEQDVLSPADGYFHASSTGDDASSSHYPSISSVPFVPNVLVQDPSLPQDKAREAEAERLNSTSPSNSGSSHPQQQHHYRHYQHRRSVEEDDTLDSHLTPLLPPNRHVPHVRTGSNRHQGEAPPAYSPSSGSSASSRLGSASASLTATPNNPGYQTFRELSAAMPLSEQQPLLHRGPESMGGGPPKPHKSLGQRVMMYLNLRRKMRFILGALVIISLWSTVMSLVSWIYWDYLRDVVSHLYDIFKYTTDILRNSDTLSQLIGILSELQT